MTHRRDFLAAGGAALAALALPLSACARRPDGALHAGPSLPPPGPSPAAAATDEAYWARVRRLYALRPDVVNLDHGWTNPAPRAAVEALARSSAELEALPAEEIVRQWDTVTSTDVRREVAAVMGVPPGEIAFVRNATEALNTVLLGLPLDRGDEIVCSAHDYFAMLDALDQRARRDGVVLRTVRPPVPAESLDALAGAYERAIGPRTRLVLLTHPSNLTGQLLPVARIASAAHAVGAQVVVDGAQSLGLVDDPVRPLGCDYYGASLHKWLGAPVGMGVLWMRPEHVERVWPAVPPPAGITGMARFEWIGTAPEIGPATLPALALHRTIGAPAKAARLRHLGRYWRGRVAEAVPGARFYTSGAPEMSCGIGTVELPGADPAALQRRLRERDAILVQAMAGMARAPEIRGLRITPNVYTTTSELDRLVEALAGVGR